MAEGGVRIVAYVITEACIDEVSQECVGVCPVDCIQYEEGKDRKLYIDPNGCIDCGACEPVCPVDAIYEVSKVPAHLQEHAQLDRMWYSDPEGVRARINELKPA